jgi:hypothetical protein
LAWLRCLHPSSPMLLLAKYVHPYSGGRLGAIE